MRKIFGIIAKFLGGVLVLGLMLFAWINWPIKTPDKKVSLGLTFSSVYSKAIELDWKENYLALLDDLKIRKLRLPVYWSEVEKEEGKYDFSDMDWQLEEAAKRGGEVVLVVGQKVPRWPECFIPEWAQKDDQKRKAALIKLIETTVKRYQKNTTVKFWQVENEPFLGFGVCPPLDEKLLDQEIATVRQNDPSRPVIVTDSGELSWWLPAARRADVFGTTMYLQIHNQTFGYVTYPIGPNFFKLKRWLIKTLVGQERAIVIELQAEPWVSDWTTNVPLEEQFKSMNLEKFETNLAFAKKSGFSEVYLWGGEWWYWLKTKMNHPEFWEKARMLYLRENGKLIK